MAIDNLPNGSDESHLSGAYFRSFVKQLTTPSKPCLNTTQNLNINNNDTLSNIVTNYDSNNNNPRTPTTTKKQAMAKPNHQHNQTQGGHKKQVRRRLHTSRPYQERLLNMAEARKEIVTALKFHRAAMKRANDRNQHQHQQQHQQQNNIEPHVNNYDVSSHHKVKSEPLLEDNSCYYYSSYNKNYNQNYYPPPSNNIISTSSPLIGPTSMYESLNNIPLPHQTLGLNLNLQAFTNLDLNFCHNNINTITTTTTNNNNPSPMAASPSSPSTPGDLMAAAAEGVGPTNNMHPSLDEEEIAKMRSIGELYQIEWDDSLNLVKSAWWFRFLKMVDFGKEIKGGYYNNKSDHDLLYEEELMEFPPWLGASNDEGFLHQQLDDSCSEDSTTLPWMDIEDIDGMDDEWLS